jgi:hypothetical protein
VRLTLSEREQRAIEREDDVEVRFLRRLDADDLPRVLCAELRGVRSRNTVRVTEVDYLGM